MTATDVAIVGGGIAGLSVAWELSAVTSVVLLERERQLASHSTGRSAAIISETYGPAATCELASASRGFLTDPPESFGTTPLVRPRGLLWVSDQPDGLCDIEAAAIRRGIAHTPMSAEDAKATVGVLRADWVKAALIEPDAMSIDVAALVDGYRSGILGRGGSVQTHRGAVALAADRRGWVVHSTRGTVRARVVVNAGGAWADEIARAAGVAPLGLQPFRRTAFVFPWHSASTAGWPLVMDSGGRFYFEPEGDGVLVSPAEETPCSAHDARADELAMARVVDSLAEATNFDVRGVRGRWAGLRTFAPDRLPVIGFDPRTPGFFWLAGQGGSGIKTAPAMAELAASLISGSDWSGPVEPENLAPERLLA